MDNMKYPLKGSSNVFHYYFNQFLVRYKAPI